MGDASPIMAINNWLNNAELIADCAALGYLDESWRTLDPTWGKGRFWTVWRPKDLVAHDLNPAKSPTGEAVDFTDMPYGDSEFDAVVLDGPYKLTGTVSSAGPATSNDDYGIEGAYVPWRERHDLIRAGITECTRVLKPGGFLLVKCQDQVNSGQIRWQTLEFTGHAVGLGHRLVDQLLLTGHREQPGGRSQQHARRNYSTMLVFKLENKRGGLFTGPGGSS